MFGTSYRITTVWGIPIKVHISLVLTLVVLAALSALTGGFGDLLTLLLLEIGIFASIALHELGHSFVAIRKGCRVREITLLIIGGAAQMEQIPRRPRDELLMAVAGPGVSVLLGAALWAWGGHLDLTRQDWPLPRALAFFGQDQINCNLIRFLGVINIGLAAFNLLPAFPMDGGRVLRALLTRRLGRLRATFIASRLGRIIAVLFIIQGILMRWEGWLWVILGAFLYAMAHNEYRYVERQEAARSWKPDPFGETLLDDDALGDKVVISPPPYEKEGKAYTADVFVARGDEPPHRGDEP